MPFQEISGVGDDFVLIDHALQTLRRPNISMEELTLAVEALRRSEPGRLVCREVLGQIDPELSFSSRRVGPGSLRPLQRLLERGVLAATVEEAVDNALVRGWNPQELKAILGRAGA